MKRLGFNFYATMFAVLFIAVFLLVTFGCSRTIYMDAEVLSVNENVLDGKMIGQFLGGSDGHITSGVVLVGLRVKFGERMFLTDAKLNNAELVHYGDRRNLPIKWTVDWFNNELEGRLNGRPVVYISLSNRLTRKLFNEFKR